jgi:hypothetical protein
MDCHGIPLIIHGIPYKTMEYHGNSMEIPWGFSIRGSRQKWR